MGALSINRKRVDESTSFVDCRDYCRYSNQIDTRVSKKPKFSSVIDKVSLSPHSTSVSRLNRYPEPALKFTREVHAPCRSLKFGGSSFSSWGSDYSGSMGFASGNQRCLEILQSKYEQAKKMALGALSFVIPKSKKDDVVSDDSDDVEILDVVGNERGSVVSDDNREREREGLFVLLEKEKLNGKALENGAVVASSSAPSGLTDVERAERMLASFSVEMPPYKRMLESVRRPNDKLRSVKFNIDLEEARLQSIREENLLRKRESQKQEVLKKPPKDSFHQPFVPLSTEEEKEIQRAFTNSNRRKILVSHENSNIQITGEMLQCLKPGAWLNDEVINIYLELLKERERRDPEKFLHCHFFNTFFYKKLIGGKHGYDYKSVRRWTTQKKLGYGLVECDKIFVPIHKEVHWCLAVINKKDKKFQYLDSLGGHDSRCLKVLAKYFVDEVKDKSGQDIDVSSWELEFVDDLPAQQNGFDCGVFMIKYADFYSRGMGLHFSQENMPYFRLRTAKEILRQRAE